MAIGGLRLVVVEIMAASYLCLMFQNLAAYTVELLQLYAVRESSLSRVLKGNIIDLRLGESGERRFED